MTAKPKHFNRWFIFGLIIILCLSYGSYALTEPLTAAKTKITFSYSRPTVTISLAWPNYGEAAIGVVGSGVLATHGSTTPLATASIVKILTALAVLKQAPLALNQNGATITLTQADVDAYNTYLAEGGSVVKVVVGEQINEYQALEAMLMPSANNMAETLARWAFGSIDAYNSYTNSYAKQLGMSATTITDPSGFLGTTVSTPHDLVILGEAALANPVIAQIIDKTSATIPVQGTIYNVNYLLGRDGIVGIKTGNNNQDQGCYLFASNQSIDANPVTIVGVIMNGPGLDTTILSALPLITSTASSFGNVSVIKAGTPVATYMTAWGNQSTVIAKNDLTIFAWNGAVITASFSFQNQQPPLKAGSQVGTLSIRDTTSGSSDYVPVVLQQNINQPSLVWRLIHGLQF